MKKIDFRPFSHLEKLATLTHLYLELRLPLAEARRAAKASLPGISVRGVRPEDVFEPDRRERNLSLPLPFWSRVPFLKLVSRSPYPILYHP